MIMRVGFQGLEKRVEEFAGMARRVPAIEWAGRDSDEVDAVIIATDVDDRAVACIAAAESGKHVFVESPCSTSLEQTQRVVEACRAANVVLVVGQEARYLPSLQSVRDSHESGKLGIPGAVRIHRWQCDAGQNMHAETLQDIDLAVWMFGHQPTEVYAVGQPDHGYLQIHLGFENDGMALIDYSSMLPSGGDYHSMTLIGSTGAAYVDDHHNMNLIYNGGDPSARATSLGTKHLANMLADFVAAVEASESLGTAAERSALEVSAAVNASLSNRQVMRRIEGGYTAVS